MITPPASEQKKQAKYSHHYYSNNPKKINYTIRFTESEYKIFSVLAKNANMKRAVYIRFRLFNENINIIPGIHELEKQVLRTGNNINQIAHALNNQNFSNAAINFREVQKELLEIKLQLLDIEKRCK